MSETRRLEALFGGTFDPIHNGHLLPVKALAAQTGLNRVTLLPNNVPPHRPQPEASPAQRMEMVKLAIADQPLFRVDRRELERDTPSWTIDTLTDLRAERGVDRPLAFIIGQDSLLSLPKWHRWQDLLSLCHLLVCRRPGYAVRMETAAQQSWLERHQTAFAEYLHQTPCGKVFLADTPLVAISATEIRDRLHHGRSCDDLLAPAVSAYISAAGLYRKP